MKVYERKHESELHYKLQGRSNAFLLNYISTKFPSYSQAISKTHKTTSNPPQRRHPRPRPKRQNRIRHLRQHPRHPIRLYPLNRTTTRRPNHRPTNQHSNNLPLNTKTNSPLLPRPKRHLTPLSPRNSNTILLHPYHKTPRRRNNRRSTLTKSLLLNIPKTNRTSMEQTLYPNIRSLPFSFRSYLR